MQTTTETITLGALAMRLGERLDRLVTTQLGTAQVEVLLGRDTAAFINANYSVPMEWREDKKSWTTTDWHQTPGGSRVAIRVMVRGNAKE
jgi:hypothetical protein